MTATNLIGLAILAGIAIGLWAGILRETRTQPQHTHRTGPADYTADQWAAIVHAEKHVRDLLARERRLGQ